MQKDQLVFISHSKNDDKIAFALCDYLESNGLQCWIAPRDNFAGKVYGASIIEGINLSKIMIVILSKSSNNSNSVESEVERAYEKKINLMTFKIDKTVISTSLEFFLSSKQWLDASNGNPKNYFPEVLRTCAGLLNDNGVNLITTAPETQNKVETFVKSNTIAVLISSILGVGFLVYSFVWTDFETIKNEIDKVPIVKDSVGGISKNYEAVKSDSETSKKVQKDPEVVTPIKVDEEDITTKEPVSSAQLEENDLDNVRFDNSKGDYIEFSKISKGNYNFNGSISGLSFNGVAKFVMNSAYKISNSNTIKGQFSITEKEISGGITLLEDNYSPTHFLLHRK